MSFWDKVPTSLYLEAQCSIEEQLSLYYLVEYFVEALHLQSTQGSLALEMLIPPPPQYLDTLQQLLLDGREPKLINEVSYHIAATKDCGKPLLQALIIQLGMQCFFMKTSVDERVKVLHSLFSPELHDPKIARSRWRQLQSTTH